MVPTIGDPNALVNGSSDGQIKAPATERSLDSNVIAAPASQPAVEVLPLGIQDFDTMINSDVKTFVNISEEIGGLVAEQVEPGSYRSTEGTMADLSSTGCRGPALFWRATQVPRDHNQGEEARHQVADLHGDATRTSIDHGSRQRHSRSKSRVTPIYTPHYRL